MRTSVVSLRGIPHKDTGCLNANHKKAMQKDGIQKMANIQPAETIN